MAARAVILNLSLNFVIWITRPYYNMADKRGNFQLMLTNLNIYYLNRAAICKYGG